MRATPAPQQLAQLPLLQQRTRPQAWRHWFDAAGVAAPCALSGAGCELFSMAVAAAAIGMGAALVPRLLVEAELASGALVLACEPVACGERACCLVTPERGDSKPALDNFSAWLRDAARVAAG